MGLPLALPGSLSRFLAGLAHLLLAYYLPFLTLAGAAGGAPLTRRADGGVVKELLLLRRGDDDDLPLTSLARLDKPSDPDLAWKAVLLTLPVPFQKLVQGLHVELVRVRHPLLSHEDGKVVPGVKTAGEVGERTAAAPGGKLPRHAQLLPEALLALRLEPLGLQLFQVFLRIFHGIIGLLKGGRMIIRPCLCVHPLALRERGRGEGVSTLQLVSSWQHPS